MRNLFLLVLFMFLVKVCAQSDFEQIQKIVASDRGTGDYFGQSVAMAGDYAIVGARYESHDAVGGNIITSAGAAYIFQRIGSTWTQVKKIVASDRDVSDNFGNSVAISGDYVIVGAYVEDHDAAGGNISLSAGAAYIFYKDQGGTNNWGQVKKIVASDRDADDYFAISVSISGSWAIVGADYEDHDASGGSSASDAGSAYIFSKDQGGTNNWGQVKKIVASDRNAGDWFGFRVSVSGDYAIVSANNEDHDTSGESTASAAGSAYIFYKNQGGTNSWGQVKKIVASDRDVSDYFGNSIAISGEYAIVGANNEDHDASGGATINAAGSAYIFSKDQGGTNNWGQMKKIVASDRNGIDFFGGSVSMSGNYAIVGAPAESHDASGGNTASSSGSAYIFYKDQGGTNSWGQVKKIVASDRDADDYFGCDVSISGSYAIAGAYLEDQDASGGSTVSSAGSAYIFYSTPITQTITFAAPATKTYGDADFAPGATASSGLTVSYSSSNTAVATILAGQIHIVGAGTATISASQTGSGTYAAASDVQRTVTVNKANLTVTAENKSKSYGAVDPAFSVVISGYVLSENILVLSGSLSTSRVAGENAGTYVITTSGLSSNNYSITYIAGTFTISGNVAQTITFGALAGKTYGDASFALGATASSGLPVSFASSDTTVAKIAGNTVTIVSAGIVVITASQAGNINYLAGANVLQTLSVVPASPVAVLINGGTVSITPPLAWHESVGAITYQVQVSRKGLFDSLTLDTSGIADSIFQTKTLANDTKYFWRVRAACSAGNSTWSTIDSFKTISISTSVLPGSIALKSFSCGLRAARLSYNLPVPARVTLKVYNLNGVCISTVVDGMQPAGRYTLPDLMNSIGSGRYTYYFRAGTFVKIQNFTPIH